MTPTPEMLAMAERIASDAEKEGYGYGSAYYAALTAIMETAEKAATITDQWERENNSLGGDAVRNGGHLR